MTPARRRAPLLAGVLPASAAILAISACSKPADKTAEGPSAPPAAEVGYYVYVTNEDTGDLTVIDGLSNLTLATVTVGKRPRGVQVSPDGKTVYVALSGSPRAGAGVDERSLPPPDRAADGVGVFDVASRRLTRVLRGVSDPEQLAVGPGGKLYVASEDTGTAVVIDPGTGKVLARAPVGGRAEGVSISPDGRFAYVTSEEDDAVAVIDTATNARIAVIGVGERPRAIAFSSDGARAYATGESDRTITTIDAKTHSPLQTTALPDEKMLPMTVALSGDGTKLFVTTGRGGEFAVLEAPTMAVVGKVKVGDRPWGMALSPDGRFAYTANGPSNDVSVVDVEKLEVTATITAGGRPWGVAVGPAVAPAKP
jgi:YVTN family beta-propeller protein